MYLTMNTHSPSGQPLHTGLSPWRGVVSVLLAFVALLVMVPTVIGTGFLLQLMSRENVYQADAQMVNPALEGKWVKVHFKHIYADGVQAQDSLFGISNKGIALKRSLKTAPDSRVQYNTVHDIPCCTHVAPRIRAGAYELKAEPELWFYERAFQQAQVPATEYKLPEHLQQYVDAVHDHEIRILTGDTGPAAQRTVLLSFSFIPAELKGDFYLVGQQIGNTLHVSDVLLNAEEMQSHCKLGAPPESYSLILKYGWGAVMVSYGFMVFCVMCICRLLLKNDNGSVRMSLAFVFAAITVSLALFFNAMALVCPGSPFVREMASWLPYASIGVAALACLLSLLSLRLRVK